MSKAYSSYLSLDVPILICQSFAASSSQAAQVIDSEIKKAGGVSMFAKRAASDVSGGVWGRGEGGKPLEMVEGIVESPPEADLEDDMVVLEKEEHLGLGCVKGIEEGGSEEE